MSLFRIPVDELPTNHRALVNLILELGINSIIADDRIITISYIKRPHNPLVVELNNEVSSSADQSDGTHQG